MQPFNYTLNTQGAGEAFTQGAQRTAGLMATAQDYQNAQRLATQQQQKAEADQYKRQRFQDVAQNPNSKEVSRLLIEFPELHEGIGKSLEFMSSEEKRNTQQVSYSVLSALEKNKPEAAVSYIDQQLEAARRSKDDAATGRLEMLRDSVISNPTGAKFGLHGILFSSMGGDKYAGAMKSLGENEREAELQPGLVEKGKADAVKEGVAAKYADEKTRTEIGNTRSLIEDRKFDQRIKAMESALKREDNALKREELQLKIDDAKSKRDESQRGKVADYETARASVDNFLDTSARLKKNPMLSRVLGPIEGKLNTAPLSSDAADAVALIDTLKSQAFLSQVSSMKGTGALSEKEGAKLESALTSLSRVQSEKQFLENLGVAESILSKVKENAANRSGVPQKQDGQKPAPVATDALSRLKQKYGVQ